jgi:putative tryptophan/tyrosine transport system substrate-binding protein
MKKNFFAIALSAMIFALSSSTEAQQPQKIPRIGFLGGNREGPSSVGAFQRGLRDLGYIEEKNILIAYRFFEGNMDRIPALVTELVQLNVDVLVVAGTLVGIRVAKQATRTIPIVVVTTQDPVATGIVDSLARPGENITGVTTLTRDLSGKRLELLKEALVSISRVGVLWDTNAGGPAIAFKEYEAAAGGLKIQLQSLAVRGPNPDFEGAFQAAAKRRVSALITIASVVLSRYSTRIAELAIKNRMPSMNELSAYVKAGGLMSYSANNADQYRRAATYVDKILKGAKPADLPSSNRRSLSS